MTSGSTKFSVVLTVALAISSGCGEDGNNGKIITESNNSATNSDTNGETSTNGDTNNDTDTNNAPVETCAMVEEFSDQFVDVEREFFSSTEVERVSCFDTIGEIATDGAYVAKLRYSAPTPLTINAMGIENAGGGTPPRPVIEVRKATCDGGEVLVCDNSSDIEIDAEADTTYYVVVNGLLDSGGVALQVDGSCDAGTSTCSDGNVSLCTDDGDYRPIACPGDCADGGCQGDACMNPVVVTPEPNGDPVTLEGNRVTFSNTWDAEQRQDCEVVDGAGSPITDGGEFFVLVEGVSAGQTVVMDAEDANGRYGFFVIDGCDADSCLGAYEFDQASLNRGEYVAPADGDVLVVVESLGPDMDREFAIDFSVTD